MPKKDVGLPAAKKVDPKTGFFFSVDPGASSTGVKQDSGNQFPGLQFPDQTFSDVLRQKEEQIEVLLRNKEKVEKESVTLQNLYHLVKEGRSADSQRLNLLQAKLDSFVAYSQLLGKKIDGLEIQQQILSISSIPGGAAYFGLHTQTGMGETRAIESPRGLPAIEEASSQTTLGTNRNLFEEYQESKSRKTIPVKNPLTQTVSLHEQSIPSVSEAKSQVIGTPTSAVVPVGGGIDHNLTGVNPLPTATKVSESKDIYYPYGPPVDAYPVNVSQNTILPPISNVITSVSNPIFANMEERALQIVRYFLSREQQLMRGNLSNTHGHAEGATHASSASSGAGGHGGPGEPGDPRDPSGGNSGSNGGGFPNSPNRPGGGGGIPPPNTPNNANISQDSQSQTQHPYVFNISNAPIPNFNGQMGGYGTNFYSRMFDPHKMRKYIGRKDKRSPLRFVREFEQCTGGISNDYVKGKLFLGTFDLDKFQIANTYPPDEGYQALKTRFLRTEWSEACREQILKEAEESAYDPSAYESMADYLICIYSKFDDCRLSKSNIFERILRKIPLQYSGQLTLAHCQNPTDFGARIRELDNLYSQYSPILNEKAAKSNGKKGSSPSIFLIEEDENLPSEEDGEESDLQYSGNE